MLFYIQMELTLLIKTNNVIDLQHYKNNYTFVNLQINYFYWSQCITECNKHKIDANN